ncbi:MAG: GNAT family N-acetyltransferase [Ignavibacteriaceae bacterium]|nr:GNAT family N-acetyltransferase [Ignavibacteriaceae bacterium]
MMKIESVVLENRDILLEPLTMDHVDGLHEVAMNPELWQLTPGAVRNREDLVFYITKALEEKENGTALPFVIKIKATGEYAGSTRFGNIETTHKRVEIGWTWIGVEWQRSFVNTGMKFLMLQHAFEVWGCTRVELKTDALNIRSRNAILRIGAKEEGTLRSHMVVAGGRVRDTIYFSIIAEEWSQVKENLRKKLG